MVSALKRVSSIFDSVGKVESGRTSTTSQYSGEEEIRASQCNTGKTFLVHNLWIKSLISKTFQVRLHVVRVKNLNTVIEGSACKSKSDLF